MYLFASFLGLALGVVLPGNSINVASETWLVELKPEVNKGLFIQGLEQNNGVKASILYSYKFFNGMAVISATKDFETIVSNHQSVQSVYNDQLVVEACGMQMGSGRALARLSGPENDMQSPYQYSYADQAGKDVDIFIVDGGANLQHNEFRASPGSSQPRIRCGWSFTNDKCIDLVGHGTEVAALAGGLKFGSAKKANLVIVKVLDSNGRTSLSRLLAGLDFVWQEAQRTQRPSVVNMSFKLKNPNEPYVTLIKTALNALLTEKIHIVASAGNDGQDSANAWFFTPGQILVGSLDRSDGKATWSNRGEHVTFWAPGEDLTSASIEIPSDVRSGIKGTSLSAPLVAGVAAVYLSILGPLYPMELISYMAADATILDEDAWVPQVPQPGTAISSGPMDWDESSPQPDSRAAKWFRFTMEHGLFGFDQEAWSG